VPIIALPDCCVFTGVNPKRAPTVDTGPSYPGRRNFLGQFIDVGFLFLEFDGDLPEKAGRPVLGEVC